MAKNRMFPPRKNKQLADHPKLMRTTYVMQEPAWADAWPHVDDWFKIYASSNRLVGF